MAAKALAKMPRKVQRQVERKISALAQNPFPKGCRPIETTQNIYRIIRSGNYRIAYIARKRELIILVIRIGHRQDFYKYFSR